jgi:pyruvate/2-oxoglutarate dehydrogenase complex dihydrolipoamide dehydrogenase (E3) component
MRGYIATNDRLETDVPGIWALGDINQRGAFTHTSYHDHEILAENLAGGQRSADDRTAVYAMFTDHRWPTWACTRPMHGAWWQSRRISQAVHAMEQVSRAKRKAKPSAPSSC